MYKQWCPYCNAKGKYYFKINSEFFFKCLICDLIYKKDRSNSEKVVNKYKNEYFDNYGYSEISGKRNNVYLEMIKSIEKKTQKGKILDVGTGCGFFLKIARERGWKVKGIDPSIKSVKIARRNNCPYVYKGTLKEYTNTELFDVITFINALDHSAHPWAEIEKSKNLLKPGGLIFLRFSNGLLHSAMYNLFRTFSLTKKVHELVVFHEYSFTPKFIKKLLRESGLYNIIILNSPSTISAIDFMQTERTLKSILNVIYSFFAIAIKYITFNQIILGTSLLVIAKKA